MRAWGPVDWLFSRLPTIEDPLLMLASLAPEERCLAAPLAARRHRPKLILLLQVEDQPSRFSERISLKVSVNLRALEEQQIGPLAIERAGLLAQDDRIAQVYESLWAELERGQEISLWIDITCLPKRFFFFFMKLASRDQRVRTLIVSYTQPAPGRYTVDHLSEDPGEVQPLPAFGIIKGDPEQIVVSVGFEALGLSQLLSEFRDRRREVFLLIPFPPGQPYSQRIWQTVQSIGRPADANLKRLHALDPFDAYTIIENLVDVKTLTERPPALAPYGPKPISLGMCLFAIHYGSAVYYTQPTVYHPDYTMGIGTTWGYCLKLNGLPLWPESGRLPYPEGPIHGS